MSVGPCCCNWGAAAGDRGMKGTGEWPEFDCNDCPKHGGGLGPSDYRCKRHTEHRQCFKHRWPVPNHAYGDHCICGAEWADGCVATKVGTSP